MSYLSLPLGCGRRRQRSGKRSDRQRPRERQRPANGGDPSSTCVQISSARWTMRYSVAGSHLNGPHASAIKGQAAGTVSDPAQVTFSSGHGSQTSIHSRLIIKTAYAPYTPYCASADHHKRSGIMPSSSLSTHLTTRSAIKESAARIL